MVTKNCMNDFMSQMIEKEVWKDLSDDFPWTEQLLEKYQNKVDWRKVSYNHKMIWTASMLEKFQNHIDWNELSESSNESVLTAGLFCRFKNKWNWRLLSGNGNIQLSYELIDRFIDCWNWEELINCYSFGDLYGWEFLERYKAYIPESALPGTRLWECIVEERERQIVSEISDGESVAEEYCCKLYPKHYPAGIGGNR